jgi:hypothetical protein
VPLGQTQDVVFLCWGVAQCAKIAMIAIAVLGVLIHLLISGQDQLLLMMYCGQNSEEPKVVIVG